MTLYVQVKSFSRHHVSMMAKLAVDELCQIGSRLFLQMIMMIMIPEEAAFWMCPTFWKNTRSSSCEYCSAGFASKYRRLFRYSATKGE